MKKIKEEKKIKRRKLFLLKKLLGKTVRKVC
jgi:hypothetical protein